MKATAKKQLNSKGAKTSAQLEKAIKALPPELQQEVLDFGQALVAKKSRAKRKKLKLDWIGGLSEYRDQFTSLELQKKAWEWID